MGKNELKDSALKEIKKLFSEARKNPKMGERYVSIARKLAMKVNLKLPSELRRKFCKHCYNYFFGDNYRVRTKNKMIVYYCANCKKYTKFGIRKKNAV